MNIATSATLVEKLKHSDDNQAWDRFYELYAPLILGFTRQRGFSETTAKDILQETMCQLLQYVPGFNYDPQRGQFRSYLLRVVMSRMSKHIAKCSSTILVTCPPEYQAEIPDPKSTTPGDEFEKLWKKNLMQQALTRVRAKVKSLTWKSFECYVLREDKTAEEVASTLGINKNMVYQHKNRVIELLRQEVKNLENEVGSENCAFVDQNYNEETVKTLLGEKPYSGNVEHFNLLRQLFLKNPEPCQPFPHLLVADSEKRMCVKLTNSFSVGTSGSNHLCLKSPYISGKHCEIVNDKNQEWVIKDQGSTNGIFVNNNRVKKKTLVDGDIIQLGDKIMVFLQGVNKIIH